MSTKIISVADSRDFIFILFTATLVKQLKPDDHLIASEILTVWPRFFV